jgi:hypothetical protein
MPPDTLRLRPRPMADTTSSLRKLRENSVADVCHHWARVRGRHGNPSCEGGCTKPWDAAQASKSLLKFRETVGSGSGHVSRHFEKDDSQAALEGIREWVAHLRRLRSSLRGSGQTLYNKKTVVSCAPDRRPQHRGEVQGGRRVSLLLAQPFPVPSLSSQTTTLFVY